VESVELCAGCSQGTKAAPGLLPQSLAMLFSVSADGNLPHRLL